MIRQPEYFTLINKDLHGNDVKASFFNSIEEAKQQIRKGCTDLICYRTYNGDLPSVAMEKAIEEVNQILKFYTE